MSFNLVADVGKPYSATLIRSERITPANSPDEVRHMVFKADDASFECKTGQSIRVMAPGRFGKQYHTRFYSIADPDGETKDSAEFALCVRRHCCVDDFNGERYDGVASNYLCDLKPGAAIRFSGPYGLPFKLPADKSADLIMIAMGAGVAPFRAFVRHIYENLGGWDGQVRLFYGVRTGLEQIYMNDENRDLANYYDQKTFRAFQAVGPRPRYDAPVELNKAIERNAEEIWSMLKKPDTHVFVAGMKAALEQVEHALSHIAGSSEAWREEKSVLLAGGRWSEILY
ncbi:MAG TPA: FAD-binding oxidoreductase [Rhodocyclaceae bacterium]|nr:FAD-binding oxidoreductase [Rhodocyclaceae bacterium]